MVLRMLMITAFRGSEKPAVDFLLGMVGRLATAEAMEED
jgi:hypothetical protein